VEQPIRLFIGSSSNGEDWPIERVYEYTLRKNTSRQLEINWMRQTARNPESPFFGWNTKLWPTPFSGFRWAVPELCGFKGRAIYTDCDMINYRDIGELYDVDLKGKPIGARRGHRFGGHEFCVMVIDCEAIADYITPIYRQQQNDVQHQRLIQFFTGNDKLVQDIDPRWNCLDGEDYPLTDIWQLHYTNMASQPWRPSWYTGQPQEHVRPDIKEEFFRISGEIPPTNKTIVWQPLVDNYNIIGR